MSLSLLDSSGAPRPAAARRALALPGDASLLRATAQQECAAGACAAGVGAKRRGFEPRLRYPFERAFTYHQEIARRAGGTFDYLRSEVD